MREHQTGLAARRWVVGHNVMLLWAILELVYRYLQEVGTNTSIHRCTFAPNEACHQTFVSPTRESFVQLHSFTAHSMAIPFAFECAAGLVSRLAACLGQKVCVRVCFQSMGTRGYAKRFNDCLSMFVNCLLVAQQHSGQPLRS